MRVGIVGVGKLGRAILLGLLRAGVDASDILVFDRSPQAVRKASDLGARPSGSIEGMAAEADFVIISVGPRDVLGVIEKLKRAHSGRAHIISTAALFPLSAMERALNTGRVYRAMPNVLVEVGEGFIALAPRDRRSEEVEGLFKMLGEVEWVDEGVLDGLTLVSASAPAVVAELMDAFLLAALKGGVPKDVAIRAISSVFRGVSAMAREKELSYLRDSVITPGGVTISLIEKFHRYNVKSGLLISLSESIDEYQKRLWDFRGELEKMGELY